MQKIIRLQNLLTFVTESSHSSFYKKHFGTSMNHKEVRTYEDLALLPSISKNDLLQTPLSDRLYIPTGRGLVKVVDSGTHSFLIKRVLSELREEQFGNLGERPTVLFSNGHESLEKSLWCYEQNTLPMIGESTNIPITEYFVHRYESDSFLGDIKTLESIFEQSKDAFLPGSQFTLCEGGFDLVRIKKHVPLDSTTLILSFPEVGACAHSCPYHLKNNRLVFHPDKNSIIEHDTNLTVTKLIAMPTPIIRYITDVPSKTEEYSCDCKEEVSFSLT
ncbi:hypothetical protein HQ403_01910 [Candidatus Kaiserbacteria bacterium]|nr:hypothetical protein [Candidatus Kaiserbacteria bacterium]